MANNALAARVGAAWNELGLWEAEQALQDAETEALRIENKKLTRVVREDDRAHAYAIHSMAAEVIREHRFYVDQGVDPQRNTDAVAAWRLVIRTVVLDDMRVRLRLAVEATAKMFRRAGRVLDPSELEQ